MDNQAIKDMAISINDIVVKTGLPLYRQIREQNTKILKLEEQKAALLEALESREKHDRKCMIRRFSVLACDCGLKKVLKKLNKS